MTLHDEVAIEACVSGTAYLLERADKSLFTAWQAMIENADYSCNAEFRAALEHIRSALEIVRNEENYLKERKK